MSLLKLFSMAYSRAAQLAAARAEEARTLGKGEEATFHAAMAQAHYDLAVAFSQQAAAGDKGDLPATRAGPPTPRNAPIGAAETGPPIDLSVPPAERRTPPGHDEAEPPVPIRKNLEGVKPTPRREGPPRSGTNVTKPVDPAG